MSFEVLSVDNSGLFSSKSVTESLIASYVGNDSGSSVDSVIASGVVESVSNETLSPGVVLDVDGESRLSAIVLEC